MVCLPQERREKENLIHAPNASFHSPTPDTEGLQVTPRDQGEKALTGACGVGAPQALDSQNLGVRIASQPLPMLTRPLANYPPQYGPLTF